MENSPVSKDAMKVKKVSKPVPKVVTLQIEKVILKQSSQGFEIHVPQGFSGTQLARFIEKHKQLIETFRTA